MRSAKRAIISFSLLLSATGCIQQKSFQALQQVNEAGGQVDRVNRVFSKPLCELESSTYELHTKVVSFEMKSRSGLEMGFNLLRGFFRLFGLRFNAETGELRMAMQLKHTLNPDYDLANVIGHSRLSRRDFSFNFDIKQISTGLTHYYETPLSSLAQKGLQDGVAELQEAISGLESPWSTNVVAIPEKDSVVVPVGSFANLQVGDQFEIYNVEHVWDGEPCESKYIMGRKTTGEPVAIAEAVQVEANASLLVLTSQGDEPVEEGAKVEVRELLGDKRMPLKRQVKTGEIEGGQLQFEQGVLFDISPYMADQMRAVLHQHNFMARD